MKYINKFDTHKDYINFLNSNDYIEPHVSYCIDEEHLQYNLVIYADTEYNINLLSDLHNLGLIESDEYMTGAEFKALGGIWIDYDYISGKSEYQSIVFNNPTYMWYSYCTTMIDTYRYRWCPSSFVAASLYDVRPHFGIDATKLPENAIKIK